MCLRAGSKRVRGLCLPIPLKVPPHVAVKTWWVSLPGDRIRFSIRHQLSICSLPPPWCLRGSTMLWLWPTAPGCWVARKMHWEKAVSPPGLHTYSCPRASASSPHRGDCSSSEAHSGSWAFLNPTRLQHHLWSSAFLTTYLLVSFQTSRHTWSLS